MRRRADKLHAASVGLVIRPGALEPGQKGVVDVDRTTSEPLAQIVRQHLHVAGENDESDVVLLDQPEQRRFLLGLGVRRHGKVDEFDPVGLGDRLAVGVVRNDHRDLQREIFGSPSIEQVDEAVIELRHHDHHSGPKRGTAQHDLGTEADETLVEACPSSIGDANVGFEHCPEAEDPGVDVFELGVLDDVAADVEQRSGDGMHDASSVRALNGEHVQHCPSLADRGVVSVPLGLERTNGSEG